MRIVIAGGGVAGVTAAQASRTLAPSAAITLFGAEPHLYYLRPGLIDVLAGRKRLEDITPYSRRWYDEHGIDYHTSTEVSGVDVAARSAILSTGEAVSYDRLLLATGSDAFCPPIPGSEQAEVFTVRTADDVSRITEAARRSHDAVVVGGGWLGLEIARALRERGLGVHVVEREGWVMARQLDAPGAEVLSKTLEALGVHAHTGVTGVEVIKPGVVSIAVEGRAETLPAQLVVAAAGVRCRVAVARSAGLEVGRGILVDDWMAAAPASGVYAAGDAAEWQGNMYGIIPAARQQAQVAAANMVEHGSKRYQGTTPQQTLKVAGVDFTVLGDAQPRGGSGEEHRYADLAGGVYRKLVLDYEGRLVGAALLGEKEGVGPLVSALGSGKVVRPWASRLVHGDYSPIA